MTQEQIIERDLPVVNELLPTCHAMGAYCLGMVTALLWNEGLETPRSFLKRASECNSVEEAAEAYLDLKAVLARGGKWRP